MYTRVELIRRAEFFITARKKLQRKAKLNPLALDCNRKYWYKDILFNMYTDRHRNMCTYTYEVVYRQKFPSSMREPRNGDIIKKIYSNDIYSIIVNSIFLKRLTFSV